MKRMFLPLCVAPYTFLNKRAVFHAINEKVVVEAPRKLIRELVEACDGGRTLGEVIRLLKGEWDERSVRGLVRELRRRNVLVDSRHLCDAVWKAVENPPCFPSLITDDEVARLVEEARERQWNQSSERVYQASPSSLGKLLGRRSSVRSFSGQVVSFQNIVDVLWSAYGAVAPFRRTVPSAGALYPLVVHVVLFRDTGELLAGIYSVSMGTPGAVGFKLVSKDTSRLIRAFLDPFMLDGAHGVVVISGSFHTTGEKYGNRSMLYVTLEAGHSAQNIHLAAVEADVATVEIGGFAEELLAEAIELPKHYYPLTTVVFGHEGMAEEEADGIEVHWVTPMAGQYRPPFTIALARVSARLEDWSYGRGVSPAIAHTKAVAEAREWAACGCVPETLTEARLSDLETAVDPREIIRFHPAQYRLKGFPFAPFDERVEYAWVETKDELTGSVAHVLADHVYFPYYPKTPPYAYANSSGVAAHPDLQKAIEMGTLELVERDSFTVAYFAKLSFPTISEKTLPEGIQRRIKGLKRAGFRVWVKNHSLDLAPVAFVFAQSEKLAYTTCSSCASFNVEHAVDHALMEVEASILARLQNGRTKFRPPREVGMPADHGALYDHEMYFRRADFLVYGRRATVFRDVGRSVARSRQELLHRFEARGWQLLTVPLFLSGEYGGNGGLHVVRSIVPGMVPMTFGYRQEPAGMERLYTIAREFGGREISYRDLPRFPHPFA